MDVCKDGDDSQQSDPELLVWVVLRSEGTYPWIDRLTEVLSQSPQQDDINGRLVLLRLFWKEPKLRERLRHRWTRVEGQ